MKKSWVKDQKLSGGNFRTCINHISAKDGRPGQIITMVGEK